MPYGPFRHPLLRKIAIAGFTVLFVFECVSIFKTKEFEEKIEIEKEKAELSEMKLQCETERNRVFELEEELSEERKLLMDCQASFEDIHDKMESLEGQIRNVAHITELSASELKKDRQDKTKNYEQLIILEEQIVAKEKQLEICLENEKRSEIQLVQLASKIELLNQKIQFIEKSKRTLVEGVLKREELEVKNVYKDNEAVIENNGDIKLDMKYGDLSNYKHNEDLTHTVDQNEGYMNNEAVRMKFDVEVHNEMNLENLNEEKSNEGEQYADDGDDNEETNHQHDENIVQEKTFDQSDLPNQNKEEEDLHKAAAQQISRNEGEQIDPDMIDKKVVLDLIIREDSDQLIEKERPQHSEQETRYVEENENGVDSDSDERLEIHEGDEEEMSELDGNENTDSEARGGGELTEDFQEEDFENNGNENGFEDEENNEEKDQNGRLEEENNLSRERFEDEKYPEVQDEEESNEIEESDREVSLVREKHDMDTKPNELEILIQQRENMDTEDENEADDTTIERSL